jgi:hypothetical protein
VLEELFELGSDGASLRVVEFPLVGVDAEGCVGFAVAEAALDLD